MIEKDEIPWKREWTYDARGAGAIQPISLTGVMPGMQRALDEDIAEGVSLLIYSVAECHADKLCAVQIRPSLPPRLRISTRWRLLYSLDQHGTSLRTMYECMDEVLGEVDGGCVIVVRDTHGAVFGAFVNEGLREARGYYGDGSWYVLIFVLC